MATLILKYKRIFLSFFFLMTLSGLASWLTMPKEEDPQLKERFGFIQLIYPGATPKEMERLLVNPLIEDLAEVTEIKKIDSTIRSEFSIIQLELTDDTSDDNKINEAWSDIQDIMNSASTDFPSGAFTPSLDRKALDQDAIVIAIAGAKPLELKAIAKDLEKKILTVGSVSKVRFIADPGRQVSITLDEDKVRQFGLDRTQIISQIRRANEVLPGGSIKVGSQQLNISTNSSFKSLDDLRSLSIVQPSGVPLTLASIASIEMTESLPRTEAMRVNSQSSIGLGVVPSREIDLIKFGEDVKVALGEFQQTAPADISFDVISFQPGNVSDRLSDLGLSLLIGILTVSGILIFLMGFRIGLITSALVPIVSLAALAVYSSTGGMLHQISISAFVLSLGLLVDNIIVVIESIQEKIDSGISPAESATATIQELSLPLLAATGTTIASFLPMLGSTGSTADFTRAIPTIAVLTLSVSYLFSVFVTPALGGMLLRKSKTKAAEPLGRIASKMAEFVVKRPCTIIVGSMVALVLSGATSGLVKNKFFPNADRKQLVLEVRFSEGTHFEYTNKQLARLERKVENLEAVNRVSSFIGRSTPRFFYNLNRTPNAPFVGQLIVEYESFDAARAGLSTLEKLGEATLPNAFVIARPLEQGPPTLAPVEIQIVSSSYKDVVEEHEKVLQALSETEGTRKVRSDIGVGLAKYNLITNDFNASQYFLSRSDLASTSLSKTRGLPVSRYEAEDDNDINIVVRGESGQYSSPEDIKSTFVGQTETASVNIEDFATLQIAFEPSVIRKSKNQYIIRVLSEIEAGYDFSDILVPALAKIDDQVTNPNVEIKLGGAAEESDSANQAIVKVMPIGIMLLLISLLVQFNSFKKVTIILVTIPLIFAGVFPALFLAGQPFSFFSLLGTLALIGIVVNTGILLVDRIDSNLASGLSLTDAIEEAIVRRIRPILLTTITTIAGLMPLALTSATLWPPFAWAMIGGLLSSTLLALVVVPSLYFVLYREKKAATKPVPVVAPATVALLLGLFMATPRQSRAEQLDILTVVKMAENRPLYKSSVAELESLKKQLSTQRGAAYLPKVGAQFQRFYRDRQFDLETPVGTFALTEQWNTQASVVATQPILDLQNMNYKIDELKLQVKAKKNSNDRLKKEIKAMAAKVYLDILILDQAYQTSKELNANLMNRRKEILRLYDLGRVSSLDKQKIEIAIDESDQGLFAITEQRKVLSTQLGQLIGSDKPVEVTKDSFNLFKSAVSNQPVEASRLDLRALENTRQASETAIKGLRSSYLPTIALQGRYLYDNPGQVVQNEWYEVGIIAKWEIFSGNTRHSQIKANQANLRKITQQQREAELNIDLEQKKNEADFNTLNREKSLRDRSFARAKSVVKDERKRYRSGKTTLNDLIDAEVLLTQTKGRLATYEYEVLKSQIELKISKGGDI